MELADQWIYDLSTSTAKQRVAKLLFILQQFFSNPEGNFWLLHRDDMSAMINIAADNVSRVIAQFKRNQILVQHKNGLYGCDRELLIPISGKE